MPSEFHETEHVQNQVQQTFSRMLNWGNRPLPFSYTANQKADVCKVSNCLLIGKIFPIARSLRTNNTNLVCTTCGQRYHDPDLIKNFEELS